MTIKSLRWLWVPAYIRTVSPYSFLILRSLWTWYFFSLVFLGSEKYPYKGILDLFANRGFADGTNAWTDIDYTCYTLSTAGEQGFLQLLPIYVDHILFPTITNARYVVEFSSSALFSQFNPVFWQRLVIEVDGPCSISWDICSFDICQVHHIDPEGQDAGVVYSEMQGRENTPDDLMSHRSAATSFLLICFIHCRNCPLDFGDCLTHQAVDIEAKLQGSWMLYVNYHQKKVMIVLRQRWPRWFFASSKISFEILRPSQSGSHSRWETFKWNIVFTTCCPRTDWTQSY